MSIKSKREKIAEIQREIEKLRISKRNYEIMCMRMNKAIEALKSAENHMNEACISFKDNYESVEANKKASEMESKKTSINLARILAIDIADEAKSKINEITRQITRRQEEVRNLQLKLLNMED